MGRGSKEQAMEQINWSREMEVNERNPPEHSKNSDDH